MSLRSNIVAVLVSRHKKVVASLRAEMECLRMQLYHQRCQVDAQDEAIKILIDQNISLHYGQLVPNGQADLTAKGGSSDDSK